MKALGLDIETEGIGKNTPMLEGRPGRLHDVKKIIQDKLFPALKALLVFTLAPGIGKLHSQDIIYQRNYHVSIENLPLIANDALIEFLQICILE